MVLKIDNNIIHINMLLTFFHYFIHSNYPEISSSHIHYVSKRYLIISLMSVLTCTASKNRCTSHSFCISIHLLLLFISSYSFEAIYHSLLSLTRSLQFIGQQGIQYQPISFLDDV